MNHEIIYTDYAINGEQWIEQRLGNLIKLYPKIDEGFVLVSTQKGDMSIERHAEPLPGGAPDGIEINTSGEVVHVRVSYQAIQEDRHFEQRDPLVEWDDTWLEQARETLQRVVAKVLPHQRIWIMRLPLIWAVTVIQADAPVNVYTFQMEYAPIWKIKTTEFIDEGGGARFQRNDEQRGELFRTDYDEDGEVIDSDHHPTLLAALTDESREKLAALRAQKGTLYDHETVVALYGANPDGSVSEDQIMEFSRPQDFAVRQWRYFHWVHEVDTARYLLHFYADIEMDEAGARVICDLMGGSIPYNDSWEEKPYAPSDPLKEDDFWDHELGEPVIADDDYESDWGDDEL